MTFSIIARCRESGRFGVAVTSSSICVASRCGRWARAGVGAVATQNITDPALGQLGLDLLAEGYGAEAVLRSLVAARPHAEFRQLAVVDAQGGTASYSGAQSLGLYREQNGADCVACGNLLANEGIPRAMVDAFEQSAGQHLAERLLRALEAGLAAGGETAPVRSAGVYVVDRYVWPVLDLRVDWHDAPIPELRRVYAEYFPQMNDYIQRAVDPTQAPGYK
ncbi:MAG: DUF1028 domain-containing protein [Betaproteobacteria bacterium]|jgi:uncharacterized Ntn-hydrolase superfamily protein|nr:DUF1028 domain-containing protein [Betaproteobacteria bacterium]